MESLFSDNFQYKVCLRCTSIYFKVAFEKLRFLALQFNFKVHLIL